MRPKHYTARYALEAGNWLVEIDEIPQVHTFGRTLARAQANIRDALGLWLQADDPATLDIRDEISGLPDELDGIVSDANLARAQADELSGRAQELTARAARRLVGEHGLTVRDAAQLLHVSHQRIHQLVHDPHARSA